MNVINPNTAATDAAAPVIAGENYDLTTEQPAAANASEFATTKLPPPKGDVVPPWPDRTQIIVADGEQSAILDTIERVASQHYYSRANSIVRIDDGKIFNCAPSYLATEIQRLCDVKRYDTRSKDYRKTDLPERYTQALRERQTWPSMRPLDAIVRSPYVREDSSINDQPGYDRASQCFAAFDPYKFWELPDSVSEEEAHAALEKLIAPFDEIPFETEAARSAFSALILTELARIALPRAPAFFISAPDKGTGKTMITLMAAIIAHGVTPSVRTWPNTGDELRKQIFASLLAGERSLLFDNVPEGSKLHSAELSALITAPTYIDRKLGVSENVSLPNKTVLVINGNNITPTRDLARRSVVVRLNGNMPGTELRKRTFKIPDLESYVMEHRVELLMAALQIIKAHQQSGHVGPTPLPTFERWSRLVRDALIWLGLPDPCDTQAETDDGSDGLADAFNLLAPKLEGRQFAPADVQTLTMFDKQLTAAMFNSGCFDPNSAQRIGYWLRENRDRYGGDFRLRLAAAPATHSKMYHFVRVSAVPNADLVGGAV